MKCDCSACINNDVYSPGEMVFENTDFGILLIVRDAKTFSSSDQEEARIELNKNSIKHLIKELKKRKKELKGI